MLAIKSYRAAVALTVFAKEILDETGIVEYALLIAVVAVDEDYEMGGLEGHLGALIVAGGSADSSLGITIYRKSGNVEHASADAFVRLSLLANAEGEGIAHELVCIEASDAVTVCD